MGGPDPKFGPFATVLRCAQLMLAVLTHECDIYTRLWCVYELFFAGEHDVNVRLITHITHNSLNYGRVEEDIGVNEAKNRVNSTGARCGHPESKLNADEIAIRKEINSTAGGFKSVDEVVEKIRLVHLLSYPMEKISRNVTKSRDTMKDAIESIIPCFASNKKLKTLEDFLSNKLLAYPGLKRDISSKSFYFESHNYMISDGATKYDVFKEWS